MFYNAFTNSLNLFPLSAKFLNASKLALAGESNTISPSFAFLFANFTDSSKLSVKHISIFSPFSAFLVASSILVAVGPVNINVFTLFAICFFLLIFFMLQLLWWLYEKF